MQKPEDDIVDRTPIWDCLQDLYMDTDVTLCYEYIAKVCSQSKYTTDELEAILFQEVLPALRFNLYALPAPEWRGFKTAWLVNRILNKHKFGKGKPWMGRKYTQQHWQHLRSMIWQLNSGKHKF